MGKENVTRRVSIYINGKEVENSLKGIDGAIAHTKNALRGLVEGTEDYDKKKAELTQTLSQLTERQKEYREELGLTTKAQKEAEVSFGKTKEAFAKLWVGLSSGDLTTAKEGFDEIKGSISGMAKSAMEFIATPLGATIAVFSGIAIGAKAIFDFNEGLQESNNLLSAFGLKGEEISKVRSEIKATADAFDKDFDEIAEKANSLSKTYKISMSEANAIIARGLADGGAQNKEFLDSLGEYDEFFAKAGYSASEFTNILNKGFDVGIYSDKLPDALKEADLSLKEQTKATRDALTNAFGASFTNEILAKVSTGQITTKKALEDIAKKANETGLSQQQNAQLTADVFKGAGEDAGGALRILEAVGAATQKEMSESTKASLALVDANERLNKAQSELFEIKNFGTIWTEIKASATAALSDILMWIVDVKKDIEPLTYFIGVVLVNAWNTLKTNVEIAFDVIAGILKYFALQISTVFGFVIKLIHGDFSGALDVLKNGFIKLGTIVGETFNKIRNHVIDGLKSIVDNIAPFLDAIGLDVDKIQKKLDSFKSKTVVLKTTPENGKPDGNNPEAANTKATAEELAKQKALRDAARQKEIDAHQRELDKKKAAQEKHHKELWDMAIALAKSKTDLAKAELDYFIANNRSKLEDNKRLTPELIAEETKRLDEIKFQQDNALGEKRLSDIAAAEQSAKSAEELVNLKKAIDLEYLAAQQNLEFQFLESTTAMKKQYEEQQNKYKEQQNQLAAEQLQAQNELELLEADNKFQADGIKFKQDNAEKLKGYKKLFDDKIITEKEYNRYVKTSEKELTEFKKQQELSKVSASLGAMNNLASALGELFGQSKELAIAQAIINGGLAVTSILSAASMGNPILDGIVKGIQIAAAVATTTSQIKKITSTKAPKTPKFFYGGFNNSNGTGGPTGTIGHLGTDEYGKITGVTHDEEWIAPKVMTQNPKYAATFSWLESERKGIIGNKYFNGGESSSGTVAPFTGNSTTSDDKLLTAINRLNDHLDKGIDATALIGYKEVKEIKKLQDDIDMSNNYGIVSK